MAKLSLTTVTNTSSSGSSAATALNANGVLIEAAVENTLSRDGTSPNSMNALLDMNGYRILNLITPATDTEPVRLKDLTDFAGTLTLPTFSGCLVKKSADLTAQDFTTASSIVWNTETYDAGGWHSTSSHTERMTIPSSVSYVVLQAQVVLANLATNNWAAITMLKNGAAFTGGPSLITANVGFTGKLNISSAPVAVTAGDYFEVQVQVQSDTSVDVTAASSWFAIHKVG